MDDYRISKRIIWILILSVTIFSSNMIISNNYNGISTKYQELTFSINSIDTPIAIFSDIDFYFYSFLGDGSKETPYIIENKNIISTNGQNAIEIKNTTKYFIIRNCYLETDAEGIRIENIANGTAIITKNTFKGNPSDAIVVTNCSFINVENNTGSNNHVGIRISYSSNITILNNSFYGGVLTEFLTASGIGITNSYDIVVRNNTLNFFNRGIYAKECGNLTIRNNLIYNTREYGSIYLHLSNNNLIENNTVYNNIYSDGLRILTSSYNEICYNTIYCCSEYGIKLTTGSNYNIVHHNNILYNYFDGEFQGFDNSIGNIWFNVTSEEGNFWSDWNGVGNYLLDGGIYNYDNYPNENPISINLEELYIPDTSNDDIYEENDFVRSSYAFPMNSTTDQYYADIDIFDFTLKQGSRYQIAINSITEKTPLYFCLLTDQLSLGIFEVLEISENSDSLYKDIEYSPRYTGKYFLMIYSDMENFTQLIPTDYTLRIIELQLIVDFTGLISLNPIISLLIMVPIILLIDKRKRSRI